MNPLLEAALMVNRRQLFSRSSAGIGTLARWDRYWIRLSAACRRRHCPRREPRLRPPAGCRGCRTLPPKAKRVIYLFRPARRRSSDLLDYKPKLKECTARNCPPRSAGPATDRHDRGPEELSRRADRSSSSPSTARAAPGSANCCRTRPRSSTSSASSSRMYTEAINHDPAITFFQTGTQLPGRPSIGRLVSLRPGQREPEPAGLRRADLAGQRQHQRPAALRPAAGAAASCRRAIRACKLRSAGDPVLYLTNPPGIDAASRRRMLDDLAALNQMQATSERRPGDRDPHRPVRDGLPDADLACRN